MILLDTNVISEPLRKAPAVQVVQWLDTQPMETLYLSTITVAELRAGVAAMAAGKGQASLKHDLETRVLPLFSGRTLAFDIGCTEAYAEIWVKSRKAGQAIGAADAFIAAIALANHFTIATRDVGPFVFAGVPVINPWGA